MTRIDELLKELCPRGVDRRPIDDVITSLRTGLNPRQNFKLNSPGAQNYYVTVRELGGFALRTSDKTDRVDDAGVALIQRRSKLRGGDVLFSGTGTIGRTALVRETPHDWNIKEGVYAITPKAGCIDPRFLIYALQSSRTRREILSRADGSTVASISMANLRRVEIPVPPIAVQREIVSVLTAFRELEAELEAGLEAELEARRRQYEHYRAALLTFTESKTEWVTLGEVVSNLDSQRRPVKRSDRRPGIYPYYGANGVQDYVDDYLFDGTFILIGEDGSVTHRDGSPVINWAVGKIWVNNHAHVLVADHNRADLRFLYFYLQTVDISSYVTGSAQPKLNQRNLSRVPVPVLHLEEQKRIVTILDRFDVLVKQLRSELPAELNARRQQYEHYRDRLLTFPEAA